MKWVLDIDGTIDANPQWYAQLTYWLIKPGNNNQIYIVTCRNPKRKLETIEQLRVWRILYHHIIFMTHTDLRSHKNLLRWKLGKVKEIQPDIWIDDEIKLYKQLYGIFLEEYLPNCNIVQV